MKKCLLICLFPLNFLLAQDFDPDHFLNYFPALIRVLNGAQIQGTATSSNKVGLDYESILEDLYTGRMNFHCAKFQKVLKIQSFFDRFLKRTPRHFLETLSKKKPQLLALLLDGYTNQAIDIVLKVQTEEQQERGNELRWEIFNELYHVEEIKLLELQGAIKFLTSILGQETPGTGKRTDLHRLRTLLYVIKRDYINEGPPILDDEDSDSESAVYIGSDSEGEESDDEDMHRNDPDLELQDIFQGRPWWRDTPPGPIFKNSPSEMQKS